MSQEFSHTALSTIEVRPLQGRKMLRDFIQLSWIINGNDPCWVPPLIAEIKEFLNPHRHPFYQHGFAEKFVAYRDGRPAGRILVSDDPLLNNRKGTNFGSWGMFECIQDQEVAAALFQKAKEWSRKNYGRTTLIGPMDYSTNYQMGLLTEGFQFRQRYLMNHNPSYYHDLVTACGMRQVQQMYAWWFDNGQKMLEKWKKRSDWFLRRTRTTFRPFNVREFDKEVGHCRTVYNASLRDNWNYAELTDDEIRYFSQRLIQFVDPGHLFLAFDGERPVGFSVTIPDLNEALSKLNGRLFPWGIFKFLYYKRQIKTGRMMVLCVDPAYRRRGISELLVLKTLDYGLQRGYINAELGWTYKDNDNVNNIIKRVGGIPYKTYSIYEGEC